MLAIKDNITHAVVYIVQLTVVRIHITIQ